MSSATSQKLRGILHGDAIIWTIFFLLCAISIIEVYSATSSLSYKDGRYWSPVMQHALFLLFGFLIVWLVHNIPCRWFKLYPLAVLPLSFALLILVMVVGSTVNGANRGIDLFGIHFQPSELAKGGVVIAVALILSVMQTPKGADKHAFGYILFVTCTFCALIAPENLSTAALLFLVVLIMMFIGRVSLVQISKMLGVLGIIGAIAVAAVVVIPETAWDAMPGTHRVVTWKHRLEKFKSRTGDSEVTPKTYDITNNKQVTHANIAIASSNIIGKMPGNSIERDFLSQAYSDFIYAIVIEELGLVGGAFVVILYLVLLFRAGKIAKQCERNFPAFLVLGLSLLLVTQAMVNMCVAVGLIPVTGQPLPLISRGGTSTLINCVYIGMILSVSRFAKKREGPPSAASHTADAPNESEFRNAVGMA